MSSEYLDSKRRRKGKFEPFNVVPLTKERGNLEERKIREAYEREVRELERGKEVKK
jgi:hypothetical protein